MQKNPVRWWEIASKDADKVADFLKKAFEWEMHYDEKSGIYEIPAGDSSNGFVGGGVFTQKPEAVLEPHLTMYIEVEDVDAKAKEIVELGGTIVLEPFNVPGIDARICLFNEPMGQMLAIVQKRD
jgi:predicted enzyme related to lactoylglutathione lyase